MSSISLLQLLITSILKKCRTIYKNGYAIEFAQKVLSGKYSFMYKYNRKEGADTVWSGKALIINIPLCVSYNKSLCCSTFIQRYQRTDRPQQNDMIIPK